eukprot:jgi/Galph1/35/GphlegSOOS_G4835.1
MEQNLPNDTLEEYVSNATSYLSVHGAVMNQTKESSSLIIHAPFTLFPSPVPQKSYELAWRLAPLFNLLAFRLSSCPEYLIKHLEPLAAVDEFTNRLLQLYKDTLQDSTPRKPTYSFGILRSDYFIDNSESGLKQIELNTIAASFAALGQRVAEWHHVWYDSFGNEQFSNNTLPSINNIENFAQAMMEAHRLYGHEDARVLFIVQPNERNRYDQEIIRWTLWKQYHIKSLRKSLLEVYELIDSSNISNQLVLNNHNEKVIISVVYFRAGYSPEDYPSEKEWQARRKIELCDAIKCPSLGQHLTGFKKIQQVLCELGELELFFPDEPEHVALLRSCFVEQYSLEQTVQPFAVELALKHPDDYVLKPQREGGGNNLYGDKMIQVLKESSSEELSTYVLMKLLRPKEYPNYLVRNGMVSFGGCISELGIFGVFLAQEDKLLVNKAIGHLLRTKMTRQQDGGVAAGNAVLDSPLLVEPNN